MYLRCLAGDRLRSWLQWLQWAEFCYNSVFHTSIKTLPFKVMYGRDPPSVRAYMTGEAKLPAVQHQLMECDEFFVEVKERLVQAQQYHKLHYDRNHREVEFQVVQWVWLCLISRLLASLDVQGQGKLGPKYFGLFVVVEHIGEVAYQLQLPVGAKIDDVSHVGLLKPYCGAEPMSPGSLPPVHHGHAYLEPSRVIKSILAWGQLEMLVCWSGQVAAQATWVPVDEFQTLYLPFQLEDELLLQGGEMSCAVCSTSTGDHVTKRQQKPLLHRRISFPI
jgi:hypothetical protein